MSSSARRASRISSWSPEYWRFSPLGFSPAIGASRASRLKTGADGIATISSCQRETLMPFEGQQLEWRQDSDDANPGQEPVSAARRDHALSLIHISEPTRPY